MRLKKERKCRNNTKFNGKIVESCIFDTPNTHIQETTYSWHRVGTSINVDCVKLFLFKSYRKIVERAKNDFLNAYSHYKNELAFTRDFQVQFQGISFSTHYTCACGSITVF
jgi:hypothetical protein